MHDAGHERMHGADVAKVTFAGKSMLELVVGIQPFRGKTLVVAGHGMRRFVAIGPDDLGARCNRNFLRRERELRDIEIDGWRGRSRRCENRRHHEGCAEDQRESGAGAKRTGGVARKNVAHGTVLVCDQRSSGVSITARSCRPRTTLSWRAPSSFPTSPAGTATGLGSPTPYCTGLGSG